MAQTIYCQKVIEKNTTHLGFKGLSRIGQNIFNTVSRSPFSSIYNWDVKPYMVL